MGAEPFGWELRPQDVPSHPSADKDTELQEGVFPDTRPAGRSQLPEQGQGQTEPVTSTQ